GRMVESENHSPREPPQSHLWCELNSDLKRRGFKLLWSFFWLTLNIAQDAAKKGRLLSVTMKRGKQDEMFDLAYACRKSLNPAAVLGRPLC
nr:hypothetical protein [Tanacetum cinerariifolium]